MSLHQKGRNNYPRRSVDFGSVCWHVWIFKWNLVVIIFANEKTLARRIDSCAGAYNLISSKEGISTSRDVICGDGYFRSHFTRGSHLLLDVPRFANEKTGGSPASSASKEKEKDSSFGKS